MDGGAGSFAMLSFHRTDTVRLLQFPESIFIAIQHRILASWPPGIQTSGRFGDNPGPSFQLKLKGKPFSWSTQQDGVGGARLVRDLLAFMHEHSWRLVAPLSYGRRRGTKDVLVFEPPPPSAARPPAAEWLAVTPMRSDRLRITGDAHDARSPARNAGPDALSGLVSTLQQTLEAADLFQEGEWSYDSFEFKLKGRPWMASGEASVKTRLLLLRIAENLGAAGWKLHASVLHRTMSDDFRLADTLVFMRPTEPITGSSPDASKTTFESPFALPPSDAPPSYSAAR